MPDQLNVTSGGAEGRFQPVIYYEEPERRRPPLTETGVIGWMRQNLFGSATDTIMTLISVGLLLYVVIGFLTWAIAYADWGVITRNLRLFMNGRYPVEEVFRTTVIALLMAFMIGLSWSILSRAARWIVISAGVFLAVLYLTPLLTNQLPFPPVYQYLNAASTEAAYDGVYLLQEGQQVTLELLPAVPETGIPTGFSDVTSATEAGQAQIDAARYAAQLARSQEDENSAAPEAPPEPDATAVVRFLSGETLEPLAALEIRADDAAQGDSAQVTIPAGGWYITETEITGAQGAFWLRLDGVVVLQQSETLQQSRVEQYGSLPDLPEANLQLISSEFTRFRGERTFAQFLRLHVGPLFEAVRDPLLVLALALALGYILGLPTKRYPWAGRLLGYLWAVSFFLVVILLRGFYVDRSYSEVIGFGLLLLTLVVMFPAASVLVSTHMVTRSERSRFGTAGTSVIIITGLLTFFAGWKWQFALLCLVGAAHLIYALDERSRRVYLRLTILGLAGVGAYFLLMQAFFGQEIAQYVQNPDVNHWTLAFVTTDRWGGLVLTLALAVVSIVASFPVGVLLALGRRSELIVIRLFCIGAIEFVRGVPLITILFLASIMVPLLSPSLANIDSVVRAMVGMTFFSGAYVAEIVRGGLQAVPHGQTEAAKAIGLSGWQTTVYIILPQALRAVIPALVGQFISLFKDTSLVFIVGLIELLGVARTVINQQEFIGTQNETLIFIGIIYFFGSYAMASASRRIEASGVGAVRRL